LNKVLLIAECGINHGGDFERAKEMIRKCKEAGADVAKFQHYDADKLLAGTPYLEEGRKAQFTKAQHEELKRYCDEIGIEYLVSVFDIDDVLWADSLCQRHKVASRMNEAGLFIHRIQSCGKPIILSSPDPRPLDLEITMLLCVTEYPATIEKMPRREFERIGLSSHCPNISPSIWAAFHGARVLENHVTLDRSLPGCDQSSSLTFEEYAQMAKIVRDMEKMA
jgi:N,N'-diacetyllegionaminate synthase